MNLHCYWIIWNLKNAEKTAPGAANTEGGYKGSKLETPTALPY